MLGRSEVLNFTVKGRSLAKKSEDTGEIPLQFNLFSQYSQLYHLFFDLIHKLEHVNNTILNNSINLRTSLKACCIYVDISKKKTKYDK